MRLCCILASIRIASCQDACQIMHAGFMHCSLSSWITKFYFSGIVLLIVGAPGLGPLSMRRDVIVFKESFRSRSYCLSECTQVCALSINGAPK